MSRMRWLQVVVGLAVLFGVGFVLLGDNPVLSGAGARDWLTRHGRWAAGVSVGLLASDILLPVPSSVVMTVNGGLFGLAVGAIVSFAGSMAAWTGCYWLGRLLGWGAGRKGRTSNDECRMQGARSRVPARRDGDERQERDRVADNLRRFGVLLLIATRPVPILAELVAATAGVARMGWWRFLAGAALGTAPICLLYAFVGSRSSSMADSFVALAVAVALPLLLYAAIARPWLRRRR